MNDFKQFVLFSVADQRYAIALGAVDQIIRAVEITHWPQAPGIVLGVINFHGDVLPVIDLRRRFGLPEITLHSSHHMILAKTLARRVVLPVESVIGVVTLQEEEVVPGASILPESKYITGVARRSDGLVLIHDLEALLSAKEEEELRKTFA